MTFCTHRARFAPAHQERADNLGQHVNYCTVDGQYSVHTFDLDQYRFRPRLDNVGMRSKPTITIKCANRDCKEVLREDVLVAAKDSEPPIERDNAGWYFITCPMCGSPYRLPPNGSHLLHNLVRLSSGVKPSYD